MSQDIQKTETNQKAYGKNSAEKDQREAPKVSEQKSLLLCSFERTGRFSLMGWMLYCPFPWQQILTLSDVSDSWRFLLLFEGQQSNFICSLHDMASGREIREFMHKGLKNTCTSFYRISWEICQKVSFRLGWFSLTSYVWDKIKFLIEAYVWNLTQICSSSRVGDWYEE